MDRKLSQVIWERYKAEKPPDLRRFSKKAGSEFDLPWRDVLQTLNRRRMRRHVIRSLAVVGVATAGLLYHQSQTTRVSIDDIAAMEDVEDVYSHKGKYPDVIILLQEHPLLGTVAEADEKLDTFDAITRICLRLFDEFTVKSLLPEGVKQSDAQWYNSHHYFRIARTGLFPKQIEFMDSLEKLVNSRQWMLFSGEQQWNWETLDREEAPIVQIRQEFTEEAVKSLVAVMNTFYRINERGEAFLPPENRIQYNQETINAYARAHADATRKIEIILTPEKLKRLYDLAVLARDSEYGQQALVAKNTGHSPLIIVYGSAHSDTLPLQLGGLNYAVIRPRGLKGVLGFITPEHLKANYSVLPQASTITTELRFDGKKFILADK